MDKVSIAQVEGRAGGGGAALVMACDMRFGAIGKAIFNNMAVPFGSVPGGGASQYMPRLIGRARSLELILGGIDLDAVTAERWGYLEPCPGTGTDRRVRSQHGQPDRGIVA